MDSSLLGTRVQDVMRCVDYATRREGVDAQRMYFVGKGRAALWCLYAAVLDERITNLICSGGLLSYRTLTTSDRYLYGADLFVPEILPHLDLPEIAAAVAPRPLAILEAKDAMKNTVDLRRAQDAYRCTQAAYRTAGTEAHFRLECEGGSLDSAEHYLSLMRTIENG
jgi:hypothetical protein